MRNDLGGRKKIIVNGNNCLPIGIVKKLDDITLKLDLFDKAGLPFSLNGQTVSLRCKKANGITEELSNTDTSHPISVNSSITNQMNIEINTSMVSVPGELNLELNLSDDNGKMTSATFYLVVEDTELSDDSIISSNQYSILEQLINNYRELENTDTSAEVVAARGTFPNIRSRFTFIDSMLNVVNYLKLKIVYGAKLDGVTDDTVALQRALDDGMSLYVPNLVLNFSVLNITNKNAEIIMGEHKGQYIVNNADGFSDIHFKQCKFTGANPIKFIQCRGGKIDNCVFYKCDKCIEFAPTDGQGSTQPIGRINISNNHFESVGYDIYQRLPENGNLMNVADIHFTNNMCKWAKYSHIDMDSCDGLAVSDNTFFCYSGHESTHHIIVNKWCNWSRICNNSFFESHEESLYLVNSQHIIISGNNFAWCCQNKLGSAIKICSKAYQGITATNLLGAIRNNIISLPSKYGIELENCDYIDTVDNIIHLDKSNSHYKGDEEVLQSEMLGVHIINNSADVNIRVKNILNLPYVQQYNHDKKMLKNYELCTNTIEADTNSIDSTYQFTRIKCNLTEVTEITPGYAGQEITIYVNSNFTVKFTNSDKLLLRYGSDTTLYGGDAITFVYDNGWKEKCRNESMEQRGLTISDNRTTIDGSDRNIIALNNSTDTTVTSITGSRSGKEITLIAFSGNTTIKHCDQIRLKGNIDAKIPSGATIKFIGYSDRWFETGRSF